MPDYALITYASVIHIISFRNRINVIDVYAYTVATSSAVVVEMGGTSGAVEVVA